MRGFGHAVQDRAVAADGLLAAAQNDGVSGFQAEGGRVGGDVRPGLVDHPHHAQRDAHAADEHAVRAHAAAHHAADGIGLRGDLPHTGGHGGDPRFVERKAVQQRFGHPVCAGGFHVLAVGGEDGGRAVLESLSHGKQGLVLQRPGAGQKTGGGFRLRPHALQFCHDKNLLYTAG